MIVLRLADGSLLVLPPDGGAVRIERDGVMTTPVNALTASSPADTFPAIQQPTQAARAPLHGRRGCRHPAPRLPFSGQIVEVLAVKPHYAVVWRADGTIEPFGAPIVKLRPLDHVTWRAMNRDFADAWRATFREPVR